MQYFRPGGPYFVGDCIPFYHDGVFHLYYLLDENHHAARGGLGAHQWAHASSADLIHWDHHPLALPITEEWECSICTGSLFHHQGRFYAYYATRLPDWQEYLSVAVGPDTMAFAKAPDGPLFRPPAGYDPVHFRDPFVFQDPGDDQFHMLVTAALADVGLAGRGGCIAHLVSPDLATWTMLEPLLVPGFLDRPECPDYFYWNGWYYLLFSIDSVTHYRRSRQPFGPWERPPVDTFDGPLLRVMKTAPVADGRRIGAAYLPAVEANQDDGRLLYAGHAVFREIIQQPDGRLGARFVPELMPPTGAPLKLPFTNLTTGAVQENGEVRLAAADGMAAGMLADVPVNAHITLTISPEPGATLYGLGLRGTGAYESLYELAFSPHDRTVTLRQPRRWIFETSQRNMLFNIDGLDKPLQLEIILQDDIIDICLNNNRCLIARLPELVGDRLFFFCQNGSVTFSDLVIRPLTDPPPTLTPSQRHQLFNP